MSYTGEKRSLKILSRALLEQQTRPGPVRVKQTHASSGDKRPARPLSNEQQQDGQVYLKRYSTASMDSASSLSRPGSSSSSSKCSSVRAHARRDRSAPNLNNLRRASTVASVNLTVMPTGCVSRSAQSHIRNHQQRSLDRTTAPPLTSKTASDGYFSMFKSSYSKINSDDDDDEPLHSTSASSNYPSSPKLTTPCLPRARSKSSETGSLDQFTTETKTFAVYKILEYLYCGTVETAMNDQLLCRLKIGYLLNASGADEVKMNRSSAAHRNSLPCMCPNRSGHSRNQMALDVDGHSTSSNIMQCFEPVNSFIRNARKQGRQVLIYSESGRDGAQALAIQYIMSYYHMNLAKSMQYVQNSVPVRISDNYTAALNQWDQKLKVAAELERMHSLKPFLSQTANREKKRTV